MPAWHWQTYAYVPGVLNVNEKLCPGLRLPLSKLPSLAVAVWGEVSLLVQVTVVPAGTVSIGGLKAKSLISTAAPVPVASPAAGVPIVAIGGGVLASSGMASGVGVTIGGAAVGSRPACGVASSPAH